PSYHNPANPALSLQRLPQILLQIVRIFDADTEPDQAVIDAAGLANLGGDAGVGHGGRVADERLDAAHALGQTEKLGAAQQAESAFLAALEADADHTAEIANLPAG